MGSESHLTLQPPESLLCQSPGGGNVASPFCWKEGHATLRYLAGLKIREQITYSQKLCIKSNLPGPIPSLITSKEKKIK